ncbi:MAG: rod shape-determining protein MreC [Nitrospirota bacterium]
MFRYLARNRGILLLFLIILSSFLIITSQVRKPRNGSLPERAVTTLLSPFAMGTRAVRNKFCSVWDGYAGLIYARDENRELKDANRGFYLENLRLREALARSARVAELSSVGKDFGYPAVVAHLIGRDASSWFKTAWIDAGEQDGVARNMPAAVRTGVVGHISKVSGGTSRLTLLTDPASAVSCITQRTREPGILVGDGTELCRFQYVGKQADVSVGDLLITSGLDGIFPEGLPVGRVAQVSKPGQGYFEEIIVRPLADIRRLEEVSIVRYQPKPLPAEEQSKPDKQAVKK